MESRQHAFVFYVRPRSPRASRGSKREAWVDLVHGDVETSNCNLLDVKFTKYNDIILCIINLLDNFSIFHLSNVKKKIAYL